MLSRSPWERFRSDRRAVACLLILCAELLAVLLLPPLLGLEPNASDLGAGFWAPPSAAHPLGTDDVGRDLLARLLCGGRVSLLIGLCSAALSALVGIPLGLLAGYRRGAWEFCLMRLADVFQSFPSIVLVLCLVSLVGPSALNLVLVLGLLVGWFWWQQNGLSSETITVSSAPDGFDGYRIAVVSDLHAKEFGEGNRVLLDYVRDLEPDLVAVVGDILHEPDQMSMIPAVAKGLAAIAPTYYVTGNHEWAAGVVRELEPLLEQCGVTVLSNEYVMLERNGDRIALLGAEDSNGYADQKTVQELADQVRQEQGAVYEILLSHRNNHYEQYTQARVDLTLAGHAHGGLIRLPGTDGLVGPKRELFPQYTAGLYDLSYGQMVVSRGLGNQFPCFRLLNRPDVPLVVLG